MKCLLAMLFLAGSLTVGLGESLSTAPAEAAEHGPIPAKRPPARPSYIVLGGLSLVSMLAWRRLQQSRS